MNPQLVAAERRFEVRRAAERWHEAGAIPPEVRDRINAAYADDRFRVGPVFRTLLFFFTLIASWALFGFFLTVTNFAFENAQEIGTVCLLLGGLLLGLGELLRSQRFRFARAGVEEAGTLLGFAWLVAAVCYWISANAPDGSRSFPVWTFLVLLTAGSGFLIWRTGLPVLGALGACGALGLLARLPAGRALWVLAGFALGAWLLRLAASPQLAPSQRRAGLFAVATLLTGAYVAIHLGSLDVGLVEILGGRATLGTQRTVSPLGRQVSIVAMALYPLAILAWAFGRRHRL
ncbi:MAG TPA: hypothetical protein PK413_05525, partial [Thermoanaerobaculia bacterium]|nr:hypothetical protein [Thermoanaerobaculia bacterium]